MSDSAFATAPYPSFSTAELKAEIDKGNGTDKMIGEIARRRAVAAGDLSQATSGERLRWIKKNREDNIAVMASEPDNGDRFW